MNENNENYDNYDEKYNHIKERLSPLDWMKFKEIRKTLDSILLNPKNQGRLDNPKHTGRQVMDKMVEELNVLIVKYNLGEPNEEE